MKKIHALSVAALLVAGLSGCTTLDAEIPTAPFVGYDLVDLTRVDEAKYRVDFEQCAVIANQDLQDVTRLAGRVAATAADRASMGIIGHRPAKDADRNTVLKRCLAGRGYTVLR